MTSLPEQSKPLTLGANRKDATRQRLVEAAFVLFHERGFDSVRIDEIAAAAGVSRRTFFRYFQLKEAVAFPANLDRMKMFRLVLYAQTEGRPASTSNLRFALRALAQEFMENAEEMCKRRNIVEASDALVRFEHGVNLEWERAIADGIDGRLRLDGSSDGSDASYAAQLAAGAIVGALIPAFRAWYEGGTKGNLGALADEAFSLVEEGISGKLSTGPCRQI